VLLAVPAPANGFYAMFLGNNTTSYYYTIQSPSGIIYFQGNETTSSLSITGANGKRYLLFSDGTNYFIYESSNFIVVQGSDLTMSGSIDKAITNATLVATGVTAGTYGDALDIPQITVDSKGRITNATTVTNPAGVPTGSVLPFAGGYAPAGYLLCQGQAVSRTTYANLYAAIGTTYGAGDGSTTFNVPNLQSMVPVGMNANDPNFQWLGKTGGEEAHTLSVNEMPAHNHTITNAYIWDTNHASTLNPTTAAGYTNIETATTSTVGGGAAHNNLQPYITLNYIIKT